METRLGAGVERIGVESLGAIVDELYLTGEDVAIAEQGPAGDDGNDAVGSQAGISDRSFLRE